jgi:hypothetical protein
LEDIQALKRGIKKNFDELERGIKAANHDNTTTQSLKGLSLSAQRGLTFSAEQHILRFLHFDGMEDRHFTIRAAHEKTFPWIFESSASLLGTGRSASNFFEWMVSEDSLYWISGKPGSGKSTLMKYICNQDRTRLNLQKWSYGSRLMIARFFFWTASKAELPKSQEGLLRSMLYQMLKQCPDLSPQTFPSQWNTWTSGDIVHDLKLTDLLAAFERISSNLVENKVKFCFFVDGLDEYEGKPNDIIPLIETFTSSPNIKTCVSSRPWNEFEKAFGHTNSRKLYMEEFNRPDIERYVRDTLEKDVTYQKLQKTDYSTPDLVKEVVDAASGVFLWVFLVVQSLLDGLTNGDRIIDLQRRLRLLPKTLKEYFKSIFSNIDDFYLEQIAHMFLVTLAAQKNLPLLTYWFIGQVDPDFAMKPGVQPLSMGNANFRLKVLHKRLNACSKGLLEARFYGPGGNDEMDARFLGHFKPLTIAANNQPLPGGLIYIQRPESIAHESEKILKLALSSNMLFRWEVDFLHRTVRDFLLEKDMQKLLADWAGTNFDADIIICKAILAQIKTSPQDKTLLHSDGPFGGLISTFRYHANTSALDDLTGARRGDLLQALYSTVEHFASSMEPADKIDLIARLTEVRIPLPTGPEQFDYFTPNTSKNQRF